MTASTNAQFVRRFREKYKITQEDLGRLLGYSALTIFRWESGKQLPHSYAFAVMSYLNNRPLQIESLHQSIQVRGGFMTFVKWIRSIKD